MWVYLNNGLLNLCAKFHQTIIVYDWVVSFMLHLNTDRRKIRKFLLLWLEGEIFFVLWCKESTPYLSWIPCLGGYLPDVYPLENVWYKTVRAEEQNVIFKFTSFVFEELFKFYLEQWIEWYRSHFRCSDTRMVASHIIRNRQVKQETWAWNPSGVTIWNPSVDNYRQFKQNQMEFFFIHELHSEWLYWDSIVLRVIIFRIYPKTWFITLICLKTIMRM